jgi:hypothetical protein
MISPLATIRRAQVRWLHDLLRICNWTGNSRLGAADLRIRQVHSKRRQGARRRDMFLWAAIILFSNQLLGLGAELRSGSLHDFLFGLFTINIFQYLAWYVIFRLIISSDPSTTARWHNFAAVMTFCLLVFIPSSRMIWIAATGLAIYLWMFNRGDHKLHSTAIVLAALSVQEFWSHVLFNLVALPLLNAETAVVGTILQAARPGTVWQDNMITGPSGYGIVVYTGCSSFHNVSLATLCWITVSTLRHRGWRGRDLARGGAVAATMILLNLFRLCLMAWNSDLFRFWHDSMGAEIFAIGASLTILLISLYGTEPARRLG